MTARKRSLGQDNVFTRVCHPVHSGGRGGGSASRGSAYEASASREGGGGSFGQIPPEPERWAVSILLECFLVSGSFYPEQECIPVGCVPPAHYRTGGMNGMAKTKFAILPFLCCEEIVKNSDVNFLPNSLKLASACKPGSGASGDFLQKVE